MIFFRSQAVGFKFQKGDQTFLLFGKLKAFYSAPVDELSGMTVNLKDADQWMRLAIQKAPIFNQFQEALQFYFKFLQSHSSEFQKIEIKIGTVESSYDGKSVLKTYKLRSWFREDRTWVQRPLAIQSQVYLSKKWRHRLSRKKWSSVNFLADKLKSLLPGLYSIEVQYTEQALSKRFIFQKN